ncbi:MAG: hypothetical protein V1776_01580 [Candidatus Diapherotrites archaeon]
MNSTHTADCQIELTLKQHPNGRPEVYDFLWEHTAPILSRVTRSPISIHIHSGWTKALSPKEWEHILTKMTQDKRKQATLKSFQPKTNELMLIVKPNKLDAFVNTYNIFFDAVLPYVSMHSQPLSIDFSRAGEHHITMHTQKKHATELKEYLTTHFTRPSIRTIRFGVSNPLHEALHTRRKNK